MEARQKLRENPIVVTQPVQTDPLPQSTQEPNYVTLNSQTLPDARNTFSSNLFSLEAIAGQNLHESVFEKSLKFSDMTLDKAIQIVLGSGIPIDFSNGGLQTNHVSTMDDQISKQKNIALDEFEFKSDIEIPTESRDQIDWPDKYPPSIIKLYFEHEKEGFKLLEAVNRVNTNSYLSLHLGLTIQDFPLVGMLMYISSWTSIRLCRAIKLMHYRNENDPRFYPITDLPASDFLIALQKEFPRHRKDHLEDFGNSHVLKATYDACEANLMKWRYSAARDHPCCTCKTRLWQWTQTFMPELILPQRLMDVHQESLFALLTFYECSRGKWPAEVEREVARVITQNFLLLMVEQMSPFSTAKSPTVLKTVLMVFDWTRVKALQEDPNIDFLLQMAREELKQVNTEKNW